jgi:hypothetical protein
LAGYFGGCACARDGGFQVILGGMISGQKPSATPHGDVDLVGLNVGGHVQIAGASSPNCVQRDRGAGVRGLTSLRHGRQNGCMPGREVFPPGSSLDDIVASARRLTGVTAAT